MTTVNNTVLYMWKIYNTVFVYFVKRVNLKGFHHKENLCNYVKMDVI